MPPVFASEPEAESVTEVNHRVNIEKVVEDSGEMDKDERLRFYSAHRTELLQENHDIRVYLFTCARFLIVLFSEIWIT